MPNGTGKMPALLISDKRNPGRHFPLAKPGGADNTSRMLKADAIVALSGPEARRDWWQRLVRVAKPVLKAAANGELRARMPVEAMSGHKRERAKCTHLEAAGRTLAGLAPWLACPDIPDPAEKRARAKALKRTLAMLRNGANPEHPDAFNYTPYQALVDASFLALGLLRGHDAVWKQLDATTQSRLVTGLATTRAIRPGMNNWLLFSAMIEAFFHRIGADWQRGPVETALRHHMAWYKGDGAYGDGPNFHWDYYNSFVIHPMLLVVLEELHEEDEDWMEAVPPAVTRAVRYAEVQERMIAPDGSFPPLGRSLAYRCGAFHLLAQRAWRQALPPDLPRGQVRAALHAVVSRTLDARGTFDKAGWLRIGLAGHQPGLGEPYISTGSLYLCTTAFLPLGLPPTDAFWTEPSRPWTSLRAWRGDNVPADHAMEEELLQPE